MENENMIEEIATCFCGYYGDKTDECYSYLRRPLCKETDCIYKRKVADIVNKHIPEGAVVLTREEAEEYQEYKRILAEVESPRNAAFYRLGQKRRDEIRKETATDIYRELMGHGTTYVKKWINNKYGVGVEE